ncbi:MAG: branched-chain amino acid aminotransferase [Desulfovibrionales bacterium]|nr:MAG: branched-chain amino acid aminotransferase [Desulfovibrionales bacterium]
MDIRIEPASEAQRRGKPEDESKLVFGSLFSDHMFRMDYREPQGWLNARVMPYENITLDPAAMVLHYGQGIFEGMKAYRCRDGRIHLFRPFQNFERMNRSATRLCMPTVDVNDQLAALEALLRTDHGWIPHSMGSSLYIRPTMIATEPHIGVRPAKEYIYYVITGPVGAYYAEGFNPVSIYVSDEFVRAVRGGVGEAKTMGNYAASLFAAEVAKKKGFTQVLWLDGIERKYIEEVGTMNIFFRIGDTLITPPLTGSILPGITRDSVLALAKKWGMEVQERLIDIQECVDAIQSGTMTEIFGSGTAAVISPVGSISYKHQKFTVRDGSVGELARRLHDEIVGIQYGEKEDVFGWVHEVKI